MKPTEFLTDWSERDRGLAVGLIALEEQTTYGFPVDEATDPDSDGHYVVERVINYPAAAVERARKEDKDPEPGTEYRVWDLRKNPEKEHLEI